MEYFIIRWIGVALEPHISQLQAVVLQELRDAFSEGGPKAIPERYLRSQQPKATMSAQGDSSRYTYMHIKLIN